MRKAFRENAPPHIHLEGFEGDRLRPGRKENHLERKIPEFISKELIFREDSRNPEKRRGEARGADPHTMGGAA
ncbi:hypothetical protein QYE76_008041 [Lolium multiflorum]|uniref:Uncharacterized protein n=1 Tax=Lolium multiflorum TaxID=4521 RepID=A0AAD8QIW5_LOLMU|nr:hypothetical protein QYE76_008041 [Lolium multiflorum]